MSLFADRQAIYELLNAKHKGKVGKGIKTLFTQAKVQLVVTFAGESADPTDRANYYTRETKTKFGVLVTSRSDDFDDDDALKLIDEVKGLLHGKRLNTNDPDSDVLLYVSSQFAEMTEGIWAHTLIFEKAGQIRPQLT